MFYGYDPTYILVIIGAILSMIASSFVQSTYSKFCRCPESVMCASSTCPESLRIIMIRPKRWSAYRTVYMEALLLLQSAWQRMNADMWYSITKDIFL